MRLKQNPSRRLALSVFLASTGSLATLPQAVFAAGHGPIYRTLDAIAGGIETVIDAAKLRGKSSTGCDDLVCDDGCDPMMLSDLDHGSSMTPLESAPNDESMPIESMPIEAAPTDRQPLESIPLESRPLEPKPLNATPAPLPRMASPGRNSSPMPKPASPAAPGKEPEVPAEDDWLDSFSPEPAPAEPSPTRRGLPTPPPASSSGKQPIMAPKRTQLRSPAETFDSLPDPFKDDQSNATKRSPNRQVGYWEPW